MSRGFSASLITELESDYLRPLVFVHLAFDTNPVYAHNGIGPHTWGAQTWTGVGDFGSISAIEEGPEISPYGITLSLSGLDSNISDQALNQDYYLRPVTIYLGAIGSDGALVDTPNQLWSGKIDAMTTTIGRTNGIRVNCESDMAIFRKTNGTRYSNQQQQDDYAGDLAFEYLDQMEDAKVIWRGEDQTKYGNANADPNVSSNFGGAAGRRTGAQLL